MLSWDRPDIELRQVQVLKWQPDHRPLLNLIRKEKTINVSPLFKRLSSSHEGEEEKPVISRSVTRNRLLESSPVHG
jgi:hypothetical protein